jgi:hypothetical protein
MSAEFPEEEFDEYERKILANIERTGCHVTVVFDPEGDEPGFAYSAGFPHSIGQGEVIVFGLSTDMMGFMINETLRQCRDNGLKLHDGLRLSGLLEGFDAVARRVHTSNIQREYLNSAMWHHMGRYGEPLSEVFQLVWPSSVTGLFPWDKDCHPDVSAFQPALYESRLHS